MRRRRWTILWLAWIAAFVVMEVIAARSKRPKPRTLSEHLWRWFPWPWRRMLLVGLLGLLIWHLLSGVGGSPTLKGDVL